MAAPIIAQGVTYVSERAHFTGWYWFGVEEVEPGYWFGYIQGAFDEWGYFSTEEMAPLIKQGLVWPIKAQDLPYAGRRGG